MTEDRRRTDEPPPTQGAKRAKPAGADPVPVRSEPGDEGERDQGPRAADKTDMEAVGDDGQVFGG
ncbi:MAG: hypothetical protein QOI37_703 [Chloroflexota bacterium]|jgi:hypothetical protein|nr:hypothetical protein [Chloroflexota bacterium]